MYISKSHKKSSDKFKTYDGPSRDQIIVRLGKACNFKCVFCNVYDNEQKIKNIEGFLDIASKLAYKIKKSPAKKGDIINFTISGGEPTLFEKEFYFSLKYINSLCKKKGIIPKFDLQTNASNKNILFYKKIKSIGVSNALISFHSVQKENFEKLMGVSFDNFYKVIDGINKINDSGIITSLNIILNKINYLEFDSIIKYILINLNFIENFYIGFVQPHGKANNNINDLFLEYKKVYNYYNKGIFLLLKNNKTVISHYVGLPACFITKKKISLEITENINFRKNYSFNNRYFINKVNDLNKSYKNECLSCLYNNICSGIWKEYINMQELQKVEYCKYFQIKNIKDFSESYVLNNNIGYNDLKKIFSSNKKHILIMDNISIEKIQDIVKNSLKIGFYKISLFLKNFKGIEKLLYSGITNYQFNIKDFDYHFFDLVYKFNNSGYGPQFKIYFDIYIGENNNLVEKYINYIYLKNNIDFINIYVNRKNIGIFNRYNLYKINYF